MVGFKLQDIQRRILYSKLEFYAEDENNFNCYGTCQPGISLLCSSSSYKIFNVMNIIFQIGILCLETKLSSYKTIMFEFKLQDIQHEQHYIPN